MSQLAMELDEQASELGFETIQDAINSGYDVDYSNGKLVKRGLGYSETVEYLAKEREKAHEAWLKDREELLDEMDNTIKVLERHNYFHDADVVKRAEEFIKKGEI